MQRYSRGITAEIIIPRTKMSRLKLQRTGPSQ